jgi:hypothetical protein
LTYLYFKFRENVYGQTRRKTKKQLSDPNHKEDAENCLIVYNWLIKEGRAWSSIWISLAHVKFNGYPSYERTYKLNIIGSALLKGIKILKGYYNGW